MRDIESIESVLAQATKVIVDEVSPDKIILFGSYARGDAGKYSDIDLMVLKKGVTDGRKISMKLHVLFFKHKVRFPIDVFVMDYDRFYGLLDNKACMYKDIEREGKVIYEK
jgi:predicted nucleotidyltransferase